MIFVLHVYWRSQDTSSAVHVSLLFLMFVPHVLLASQDTSSVETCLIFISQVLLFDL